MNTAVEDPALADKKPQPFEPAPAAAAVAAAPAVAAPAVAPAQQPSPEAASNLFSHFADGPAAAPAPASESAAPAVAAVAPKKVKTQAIHSDAGPMNAAIAAASGLSKAELPTAASTANNIINESGAAGVTNLNQVAYEMATARRESHMGNWMNEFGGNNYFEQHYGYKTKKGAELGNTHPHDGANFHGRGLLVSRRLRETETVLAHSASWIFWAVAGRRRRAGGARRCADQRRQVIPVGGASRSRLRLENWLRPHTIKEERRREIPNLAGPDWRRATGED